MRLKYADVKRMNGAEIKYNQLIGNIVLFKEQVTKVTLYRQKNGLGRLISIIVIYLIDNHANIRTERVRVTDDWYIWWLLWLQADFGDDIPFEDLSPEEFSKVTALEQLKGEKGGNTADEENGKSQ